MEYINDKQSNEELTNILEKSIESLNNINSVIKDQHILEKELDKLKSRVENIQDKMKDNTIQIAKEEGSIKRYIEDVGNIYTIFMDNRVEKIKNMIVCNISDTIKTDRDIDYSGMIDGKPIEENDIYIEGNIKEDKIYLFKRKIAKKYRSTTYYEIYKCIGNICIKEEDESINGDKYNNVKITIKDKDISNEEIIIEHNVYNENRIYPLIYEFNSKLLYKKNID